MGTRISHGSAVLMAKRHFWHQMVVRGVMAAFAWTMLVSGDLLAHDRSPGNDPAKELKELSRQLEKKRKERQSAEKKEHSVLGELERLDYRIHMNRRKLTVINRQFREQRNALAALDQEIAQIEQRVDGLREKVGVRLRAIYMSGEYGEWQVLFGAQNYQELFIRLETLQRLAWIERELMQEYEEQQQELLAHKTEQDTLVAALSASREKLALTLSDVNEAKSGRQTYLAKIRKEGQMAIKAISELEESAKALQGLLKELEKKEKNRRVTGRIAQLKGKLPWPREGKIIGLFGRQQHPRYNTDIYRRGIEIKAAEGASVKAVHEAVVAYADWFRGYGLVVVLDHGDHYYTLYAHLGEAKVKVGQAVTQGQVIGDVGEAGLEDEQTLYFEFRHFGKPLDPLGWLKKR